jgi:hypothetical protein
MELVELVPHWIDKLKKLRVPVNGVTQMIVGPGARAASKDAKAVRALLIQGLEFEAKPDLPAAFLPTRERLEKDAGRALEDEEYDEIRTRLHGAIALMFEEGMLS